MDSGRWSYQWRRAGVLIDVKILPSECHGPGLRLESWSWADFAHRLNYDDPPECAWDLEKERTLTYMAEAIVRRRLRDYFRGYPTSGC